MVTKAQQYAAQSEAARAEIATWPMWMQRNLEPTTMLIEVGAPPPWVQDLRDGSNSLRLSLMAVYIAEFCGSDFTMQALSLSKHTLGALLADPMVAPFRTYIREGIANALGALEAADPT